MYKIGAFTIATLITAAAMTLAAQEIPAGTVLPVMLRSTLNAKQSRAGERITAGVMQDVPLPDGKRIPRGSQIAGRILEVQPPVAGSGSRISLSFDEVLLHGQRIPVSTSLRAMASMMDVFEAKIPTNSIDDYGTSPSDWNTIQVGGEGAFRGSGELVSEGTGIVGRVDNAGYATAKLADVPSRGCRARVDGDDREQALWVFSTTACGIYGFSDLSIAHAGRSAPVARITLESAGNILVRSGSGLLLRVQAPGN